MSPKRMVVARSDDFVTRMALRLGLTEEDLREANPALFGKRKDQALLASGDVISVPKEKHPSLPLKRGAKNRFQFDVPRVKLEIRLLDRDGAPLANQPFRWLDLPDAPEETTDGDGIVRREVPCTLRKARLLLTARGAVVEAWIGALDPHSENRGRTQRLANLGFRENSQVDVVRWKRQAGMEPDGQLAEADIERLEKESR